MELIIGGCAQNKIEYARSLASDAEIINDLHLVIKEKLAAGMNSDQILQEIITRMTIAEEGGKNLIIISDEIGGGIVPLDAFERQWREVTGRLLCRLAEEAEKVTRLVMGLPQVIKG